MPLSGLPAFRRLRRLAVLSSRFPSLLGCFASAATAAAAAGSAFAAAFLGRRLVFGLSSSRSGFLSTAGRFIHGRPCTTFCFFLGRTSLLISFFNMLSLPLLLIGIGFFASSRHSILLAQVAL